MHSHANRGKELEDLIEAVNEGYALDGKAVIDKQHTKWLPIRGRDGAFISAKVDRPATVDFRGTVKGVGGVSFDAKQVTKQKRWYLRELKPHQVEHLKKCQAVGDVCFVLVGFWNAGLFFILPLNKYLSLQKQGIKSLTIDRFQKEGIPIKNIYRYLDYLPLSQKAETA
jgi:recombination protein U